MNRISRSATSALTSSAVFGWSDSPADPSRWLGPCTIDVWPNRHLARPRPTAASGRSVAGDGSDEVGDLFGFLAPVELRRHLAEAARAAFGDRVEHERLASRFGGDLAAHPDVEVRAGATDRLGARQCVAHPAGVREQVTTALLFGVQMNPTDADA